MTLLTTGIVKCLSANKIISFFLLFPLEYDLIYVCKFKMIRWNCL